MVGKVNNIYLVNAPAGSGKTTTIRRMVEDHMVKNPNDNILCITFTNRAAEELGKEIDSKKVFFGTIHSFINCFVSSFFSHEKVIDFYCEMYREDIENRIKNIRQVEAIIESNNKYKENFGALDLETIRKNIKSLSYAESPYTSLYYGALSHDDLIHFTRCLVDKYPNIGNKIALKYQLVFIDEYQDTSADVLHIFYEAIKNSKSKLYLLGDKMQQIYRNYDGSFEDQFSKLNRSYKLSTNFRTTPYIVSILNCIYNDDENKQIPYKGNKDCNMMYFPEVIITTNQEQIIRKKEEQFPNALKLFLLNRERFIEIGAYNLYKSINQIEQYSYGRRYEASEILINNYETNPDKLLSLLFLLADVYIDFKKRLYGKLIQTIRKNKNMLNYNLLHITEHQDKERIYKILSELFFEYEKNDANIKDIIIYIKENNIANNEYIEEILTNEDYIDVLNVLIREFRDLCEYLSNPKVSTQHGVKGESHDTVLFIATDGITPSVKMYKFFELWSKSDVSLKGFEVFYYDFKNYVLEVESICNKKVSDIKAPIFKGSADSLTSLSVNFAQKHTDNMYYNILLKENFDRFFIKPQVTSFNKCIRLNDVYAVLLAYKLFYVGCSRAKRNLTVIVDQSKISSFESPFIKKLKQIGFRVFIEDTEVK